MAKKKKKSKAGDARGYGQATVYRQEPTPQVEAARDDGRKYETETNADTTSRTPLIGIVVDDWDTAAVVEDEEMPQDSSSKKWGTAIKKIPPLAEIHLPSESSTPLPSKIVLSAVMDEVLQNLTAPLEWHSFVSSREMPRVRSDRVVKKMAYMYDYLLEAGFSWEDIRDGVEYLGNQGVNIDINAVLDWLCYSLDIHRVPLRFLGEREALAQAETRQQNEVVVDDNLHTEPTEVADGESKSDKSIEMDEPTEEETEESINKELNNNKNHIETAREKTEDETLLEKLEKDLAETTFDCQDEASNYLRSKQEIKELEKRRKELQKGVVRLRNKVEKARQRKLEEEVTPPDLDVSGEEEEEAAASGGFFDIDSQDEMETNETAVSSRIDQYIDVPRDAIPKGWTGKTPKEIFEERCRALKLSRPKFETLDRNGCRVIINGKELSLDVQETKGFGSKMDGQHYVATQALYQLDSTLPIYRSLPPYFADLWKGWQKEAEDIMKTEEIAKEERRKERIFEILSLQSNTDISTKAYRTGEMDQLDLERINREVFTVEGDSQGNHAEDRRMQAEFEGRITKVKYQNMLKERVKLPIYGFRDDILETVAKNPVTVLCAETGAGKTTQCPQFILEHALRNGHGASTSILCTQPRRVAATSMAERVAEEMGTKLGDQVGYSIRLENRRSKQTRLLFCTTGVILRRLIEDPLLKGVSHVVVDEVHERQWQIDVLLVALRSLVRGPRRDLKVVLMSATLDAKLFCSFFATAPFISVPGRTYPVSNYFLEDLVEATGHIVEDDSPNALYSFSRGEKASLRISTKGGRERKQIVSLDSEVDPTVSGDFDGYSMATRRTMDRVDESVLNYDLIEDVLHLLLVEKNVQHMLTAPEGRYIEKGAILIFLPGIGEIRTLCDRLQASPFFKDQRTFDIIPMHSALSSAEQRRAFMFPRKVQWAIIVATNIAETSVTIPDAVAVIDSGRVREVRYDKRTLTRRLVAAWCSRASTKQRAGRAGRVQPGICLRLFSSRTHQRSMTSTTEPELQRIPLEEVCLTILAGGLAKEGCHSFLSQTPQPPKQDAIQVALTSLEQVGAISSPTLDDDESLHSVLKVEKLTKLGLELARLPVDARLGKMLLLGVQFRCIDTIATIVAGLSVSQSLFLNSLRDDQVAKSKQAKFHNESSDFMTLYNLYNAFIDAGETFSFCRDHYVSFSALREMKDTRRHFLELLRGMGWLETDDQQRNSNGENEVVLHAVIGAALSQIARIDRTPDGKDTVWHRSTGTTDQQVHVHKSSVNRTFPRRLPSRWLVFFEKFATSSRVSISTTAFCSPLALVLMVGHDLQIQHAARQILLNGWMHIGVAARVAIHLRALRDKLRDLHKEQRFVEGVVALLKEDAQTEALWQTFVSAN